MQLHNKPQSVTYLRGKLLWVVGAGNSSAGGLYKLALGSTP